MASGRGFRGVQDPCQRGCVPLLIVSRRGRGGTLPRTCIKRYGAFFFIVLHSKGLQSPLAHCKRLRLGYCSSTWSKPSTPYLTNPLEGPTKTWDPPRLLSRIRALHTDFTVNLPVGDATASFGYTVGVKQGDSLAPVLFLYCVQAVLYTLDRSWDVPTFRSKMDDKLNGRSWKARGPGLIHFKFPFSVYADDTALVFESRSDLERGAAALRAHFTRWGLSIHVGTATKKSKTEALVVPRPQTKYEDYDTSDIVMDDGGRFHFTETFRYLGVTLSSCINDDADVDSRIAKASGAFACLSHVFLSSRIKPHAKRAAYVGTILPILLYGAEAWCLTEGMLAKLRRFHNYSTRRMCGISNRSSRFHHISARNVYQRLGLHHIDTYIIRRHL